ncbi:MAG: cupin domain-containing protein [Pseudomonas oryzihabitans]
MTNLFNDLPETIDEEVFTTLLARPGCRLERILSQGQTTPLATPYRQAHDEWVVLLAGAARIALEGREVALRPGDTLFIPAHTAHWVTYTDPAVISVWLAVHIGEAQAPASQPETKNPGL